MEKFFMPTKVIIGENCVAENFSALGKKALIVTGRNSARVSGALKDIENVLAFTGTDYAIFDEIENNPSIETVLKGGRIAKQEEVDFIIACGGGSPLDAGKAIAAAYGSITREALINGEFPTALPIIAVPTTAGTGSEVTPYSILTDANIQNKRNISREDLFPKIAYLDAKYTMGLDIDSTINTAIDALTHAVEGYLSNRSTAFSDVLAIEAMEIISKKIPLLKGELSLTDRQDILYASMLSGVVISQTGTTILHSMGYHLTYFKNVAHGRANGLLFGEYMKLLEQRGAVKVKNCLNAMGMINAQAFCDTISALFKNIEVITSAEVADYSKTAFSAKSAKSMPIEITISDVESIYSKSLK